MNRQFRAIVIAVALAAIAVAVISVLGVNRALGTVTLRRPVRNRQGS
jgi:hypothetical protein